MKKWVFIIFGIAFLVRLIHLDQSLWLDEAVVAKVIQSIPLHLIPVQFSPGDFHPPFYYLFMSLWSKVFGFTEISLRFPSIIFSLLTGWLVYKIGLLFTDQKTSLWAMVFFLFNPLIIYYSQEARMYMMATFFLTTTLFFFIEIVKYKDVGHLNPKLQILNSKQTSNPKFQKRTIMLFIIFLILSIFTFYGSVFFIVALILYALIRGKLKIAWLIIATVMLSTVLLSPLLYQQVQTAKTGLIEVKNWSLVLGKANVKNLFMIFIKFSSGRLSWTPKWLYYVVVGSWSFVIGFFVFLGIRKSAFFCCLFIIPLLVAFIISFFAPMLQYFRFIYLIPLMSLILATGLQNNRFYMKFILIGLCIFACMYLLNPQFHREDWKSLSRTLDPLKPVYMILPSSDPLVYYQNDIILKEIRSVPVLKQLEKSIYVIPYVTSLYGFDYVKALEQKGCVLKRKTAFRELMLEEWSCGFIAAMPLPLR